MDNHAQELAIWREVDQCVADIDAVSDRVGVLESNQLFFRRLMTIAVGALLVIAILRLLIFDPDPGRMRYVVDAGDDRIVCATHKSLQLQVVSNQNDSRMERADHK